MHQSGYDYKKRKSRSKMFGSSSEPEAKRPKTTKTERLDQLKGVRQQLSDVKDRVKYKRQRLAAAETSKNYKLCDQLSEEIADLNKEMILQEKEVKLLQQKEKKSLKYYSRKKDRATSSESDRNNPSSSRSTSRSVSRSATPHPISLMYPTVRTEETCVTSPPPVSVTSCALPLLTSSPVKPRSSVSECEVPMVEGSSENPIHIEGQAEIGAFDESSPLEPPESEVPGSKPIVEPVSDDAEEQVFH